MLRVTIELVPQGNEEQARRLRTIEIVNEHYDAPNDTCEYTVRMYTNESDGKKKGMRYMGHNAFLHRRSDGAEVCVARALKVLGVVP